MSSGRFAAASSLAKMIWGSLVARFLSTSVTRFRPAAFSAFRKLVRSSSTHWLLVLVSVPAASAVVPVAGRVFHVSPVSLHVVFDEEKTPNPNVVAAVRRPYTRSLAEPIVAADDRSNRR